MGILDNKKEEAFIPGCRYNENDNTYDCKPKWKRKSKPDMVVDRPVKVKFQSGDFIWVDSGGASDKMLKKLGKHFKEKGIK